jgi:hypothetical protein
VDRLTSSNKQLINTLIDDREEAGDLTDLLNSGLEREATEVAMPVLSKDKFLLKKTKS